MGNVTEEKWIEMLEKKADGNYVAKYPKVKSKSGVTFDEHLAENMKQRALRIPKRYGDLSNLVLPGWSFSEISKTATLTVAGYTKYIPIYITESTVFTAVGTTITTAVADSYIDIAIYNASEDLVPSTMYKNLGTIVTTTTGYKEIVGDIELHPGYYFLAMYGNKNVKGHGATAITSRAPVTSKFDYNGGALNPVFVYQGEFTNPASFTTGGFPSIDGCIFFKIY